MPTEGGRNEVRPLVFGDASDYSPTGRVAIALQRFSSLDQIMTTVESMKTSNMLVHPEDISKFINVTKGNSTRSSSAKDQSPLPNMKPSSFSVSPEADIDTFLSVIGSPDDGDSVSEDTDVDEKQDDHPFGTTPIQRAPSSPLSSLRTAIAAADQALYSYYHVIVVLDMSQSAFAVARNGDVLIDRMPLVVDLILSIVKETVAERTAKYAAAKKRAMSGGTADRSGSTATSLLNRVWCPKICVSLLLGNAPHRKGTMADKALKARPRRLGCFPVGGGGPALSTIHTRIHDPWGHATSIEGEVPFIPHNSSTPFEPWAWHAHGHGADDCSSSSSTSSSAATANAFSYAGVVPIFIARPADEIIADSTLNHRIFTFLRQQERFIREMAAGLAPRGEDREVKRSKSARRASQRPFEEDYHPQQQTSRSQSQNVQCEVPAAIEWEASNIAGLIETIVSMLPADSNTSHTVAIVSNFANTGASEDVALLRPAIMTKGVTLGLFSLTAVVEWNWSHLAPIGCLLSTTGGFSVPYARVEAHRNDVMNSHWLRRVDDTDCLARSMFLRRLTDYPVAVAYSEEASRNFLPMTFPNGEMQTATVHAMTMMCHSTLPITGLAAARVAEGWSAQIEVDTDSRQPKRCRARHHCFLHRGELTLYYEAEAVPLLEPDVEGRTVVIRTSLIAYASSHVIADMAFILKASEDMRVAIEKKGGRRLTISALLRQFLTFMKADCECVYVCDAPHMAQRSSRPTVWDDRFVAAVATHSRSQGCSLPWLYRHNIRQMPLVVQVPELNYSVLSGSLLTHSDRMARTGSVSDGASDGFDTAAGWRRSRSGKVAFAPTASRRHANAPHAPPSVNTTRLAAFITAALSQPSNTDVTVVKNSGRQASAPLSLTYLAIGRQLLQTGLDSMIPSCCLVQFFLLPATNECGQEVGMLEGLSGVGGGLSGGGYNSSVRDTYSTTFASSSGFGTEMSRSSYLLANCVEVRFTFSFVSIRNQAPTIRRVMNLLDEHAARIATGAPAHDFRYLGLGRNTTVLQALLAPFQMGQASLLLQTDSEGTSSATNSHIRHGMKRGHQVPTAVPLPTVDDTSYACNFDRISSLSTGSLYWSTLIPAQHNAHMYRNTMACLLRRRLALGFEILQYTACGTWAVLHNSKESCIDVLQVHEHPNHKGYDCVLGVARYWDHFDERMRPSRNWQSSIDFQRDHYILSTFHTFTTVLNHATNRLGPSGIRPTASAVNSGGGFFDSPDFFSKPASIAAKDFVRNGGHTDVMFCLSGLLIGLHADASLSMAPIDCITINVSSPVALSVGIEVLSRMHAVVRNMAVRRHFSHAVPVKDLPPSIQTAMAPKGMCTGAVVTISPCDDSSFIVIIVPLISPQKAPLGGCDSAAFRVFVAEISMDSIMRGMSSFSKTEVPKTYYDSHYGIARPMLGAVPRVSTQLISVCATLEVYCVASRAWLLQRAAINIPANVPIPTALRDELFNSFKGLSLYSQDVDASFINKAWGLSSSRGTDAAAGGQISTEARLASTIEMFLKHHSHALRPLQGADGDDEMARTTFLVTSPAQNIFNPLGGQGHPPAAAGSEGGMLAGMLTDCSDGHVSSASAGHRTDGEGGTVSAPAEISATYVPMVMRFLVYSKDTDGHGTSAWVGSKRAASHTCGGVSEGECASTARPVTLFLRIYIVSLPHDVFNITSHAFKPPSDILRRFLQDISEDLTSTNEPIPPSWNYFSPHPFSCDDLLLPFNAMPQSTNSPLTDPMLLRFVRLFPCKGVGESNQLPSPSCTDIVNAIATRFLAQTADAALTMLHKALLSTDTTDHESNVGGKRLTFEATHGFFSTVVSKALLAPEQYFRSATVQIGVDVAGPELSEGGRSTEQLMEEVIKRDGLFLVPLGNLTYGYVGSLSEDETAAVWILISINAFDSTMHVYKHVTEVQKETDAEATERNAAVSTAPSNTIMKRAGEEFAKIQNLIVETLRHIYLSQYLFKLRATRWAHEEDSVIPRWWGVQYPDAVPSRPNLPPPPWEIQGPKPTPTVKGEEVLSFPVHSQFQPKRLLNQMHFSRHFDMLKIVDRRGCFIVPDEKTDYIWHFIRILVIPEGTTCSPDDYPPLLPERPKPTDRFRLVVHIYKSTMHYSIEGTIQAVQECYDGIAVKELMQFMGNSSKREALTDDDLALLIKEKESSHKVSLCMPEKHTALALAKLQANLAGQKFLPIRKWSKSGTLASRRHNPTVSNSVGETIESGVGVDCVLGGAFIYFNPAEPIDIIVVSAEVTVDTTTNTVQVDLYSSWAPRYEEEKHRLARCVIGCNAAIANTQKEMAFVSIIDKPEYHALADGPSLCDSLIHMAETLHGPSTDLRYLFLRTTPRLSTALFSQYVESFCGVLSELTPSLFVHTRESSSNLHGNCVPEIWTDFAWHRHEETQHRIDGDQLEFYIVCGLRLGHQPQMATSTKNDKQQPIKTGASSLGKPSLGKPMLTSSSSNANLSAMTASAARFVLSSSTANTPVQTVASNAVTNASSSPDESLVLIPPVRVVAVKDVSKKYIGVNSMLPAVIVRVTSLGTSIACHSVPDADMLFDTLSDVNNSYSKRLGMMQGLLTQMLGIHLSPFEALVSSGDFTQGKLATRCCGDVTNVHVSDPIDVTMGCARRHMSLTRAPSCVASALPPAVVHNSASSLNTEGGDHTAMPNKGDGSSNQLAKSGVFSLLRRGNNGGPALPSVASLASLANTAKESHTAFQQATTSTPVAAPSLTASPALMHFYTNIIYAGLTNRGVMVDYCLPMDAAVKVLHDDGGGSINAFFSRNGSLGAGQNGCSGIQLTSNSSTAVLDSSTKSLTVDSIANSPDGSPKGISSFPLSPPPESSNPPLSRYARCEVIVKALVKHGYLAESADRHNAGLFKEIGVKNHHAFAAPIEERLKVLEIAKPTERMPVDPFVPQHYHRHLAIAHIITERRYMSRRMVDSMSALQVLWNRRLESASALPIVHSLIKLMSISKYYYGSRVPEYSLRKDATAVSPEVAAQFCNPKKKVQTTAEGEKFEGPVRANLMHIVHHLNDQFELLYIIAVNPKEIPADGNPALLERLSNRCGLVATNSKEPAVFATELIYCAIPIRTAIAELLGKTITGEPIDVSQRAEDDDDIGGGLFIMEVGFNYVNYAIDMYVATDGSGGVPSDLVAEAASAIRSKIQFSSVVYDFMVRRLFDLVATRTAVLPGYQNLTDSLSNIVKYNPTPPRFSYNHLACEDVTSALIQFQTASGEKEDVIRFVVNPGTEPLSYSIDGLHTSEGDAYTLSFKYAGLLQWETLTDAESGAVTKKATLYTLLVHPDMQMGGTGDIDAQKSAVHKIALKEARDALIRVIQSNDQQALVDSLWRQVRSGLNLTHRGLITPLPRKVFPTGPHVASLGGFTRCPSLSFTVPPLPIETIATIPTSANSKVPQLADLVVGLDGDASEIKWEELVTMERFVTRIVDPTSTLLLEELRKATAEVGSDAPFAWRARIPQQYGLPSSSTTTTSLVTLSYAEAVCVYLRASPPSLNLLEANNVTVHIVDTSTQVSDSEGQLNTTHFTRIVFVPPVEREGCGVSPLPPRFFTSAADANYIVVVEISRPAAASSSSFSHTSPFAALSSHAVTCISLWREGYGSYGQSFAELTEGERRFLSIVHGYLTAVLWAGFL